MHQVACQSFGSSISYLYIEWLFSTWIKSYSNEYCVENCLIHCFPSALLFRALRSFPPPFYHLYFSISLSFNISNGYNSIKIWLKRLIPVSKWLFSWMNSKKKLYRNNRKERKKFRRKRAHYEPEKQMIPVEKLLNEHIQFTSIVEECKRKTKKQITVIKCTRIPKWKGK